MGLVCKNAGLLLIFDVRANKGRQVESLLSVRDMYTYAFVD
jgi:hypothetical protein